jgi:hypothetical protein
MVCEVVYGNVMLMEAQLSSLFLTKLPTARGFTESKGTSDGCRSPPAPNSPRHVLGYLNLQANLSAHSSSWCGCLPFDNSDKSGLAHVVRLRAISICTALIVLH